MLSNQVITIHPYWLRGLIDPGLQEPTRFNLSQGWLNLITVQALRLGLHISNASGGNPLNGYDIFVQSFLLNMSRRFVNSEEMAMIDGLRNEVKGHLAHVRSEIEQATRSQGANLEEVKILFIEKINQIYDNPALKMENDEKNKYRVFPDKSLLESYESMKF